MAIQRITANDFADIIAAGVNERDSTIDTRVGPVRDLFVDPFANILEQQNNRMVYLNKLASISNANEVVPDDLDDIVFNEGLVRWSGTRSIVTLTFSTPSAPGTNVIVPANFPVSTLVDPNTGTSVVFRTTESNTMYAASASQYYNAATGKYELSVAAMSTTSGISSSVGANTITVMRRPIVGFDEVTNKQATTAGKGIETNSDLADRYLLHITGSQLSTPNGIKSFAMDNFSVVDDVYVVYGTNPSLTREESDAGAVDIWIKGEQEVTRTYNTIYPGTETIIELDRNPLVRVLSVASTAAGVSAYTQGTDYEVITGQGSYSYSNFGIDGIKFIAGGTHPDIGDDLVITYVYNGLIGILDSYFKQNEYFVMGSDRLFRWAQPQEVYVEASLKVNLGSPSNVMSNVRLAILELFNEFELGDNVEEFDIARAVSNVVGVDNFIFDVLDISGGTGVGDIEIGPNQYARLLSSNLVINLI